jgi:aromatic ring-cleaving dioxygenase
MIQSVCLLWLVLLLLANDLNAFVIVHVFATQQSSPVLSFSGQRERSLKPLPFLQRSNKLHATDDRGLEFGYTLKERNPFDVHVYYAIPDQQPKALALREKMQRRFAWMRFYEPRNRPIGPHPIPMWEADFGAYKNRHKWKEVCEFLEEEHGDLSVLVHPHSIDGDYADHTDNARWIGAKQKLLIQGWKR